MKKLLCIFLLLFPVTLFSQYFVETQKVVATDRTSGDYFGKALSVYNDYAVMGAELESEDQNGFNTLMNAGSVYAFKKNASGQWQQTQKLIPNDRNANDYFGSAVSLYDSTLVVGAYEKDVANYTHAGSVYIFDRNASGNYIQKQKIVAPDTNGHDHFGYALQLHGTYLIIGSPLDGDDQNNSNTMNSAGSVYIYERNGSGIFVFKQKLVNADRNAVDLFGAAVSINGSTVAVGAYREDEDTLGGNTISDAGSVYIFERNGLGNWNQKIKLVPNDRGNTDRFGVSVALENNFLVIGSYLEDEDTLGNNTKLDAGSAYIFKKNGSGVWQQHQKIVANDRNDFDKFGSSVALSGNYIVVGAPSEDEDENGNNTLANAGSAYIFKKDVTDHWAQVQKIVNHDRVAVDLFGSALAINGTTILAGAYLQDYDANSTNGLSAAGAGYFYKLCTRTYNAFSVNSCASYVSPSGNYVWTTSGSYQDTILNSEGCDSVLTIQLNLQNTFSNSVINTCYMYTSPSGNYIWTTSGNYNDTLTNSVGCDSIISIQLNLQENYNNYYDTACYSYTSPSNNYVYYASGNYNDTLTNSNNCDSIITLHLVIYSPNVTISQSMNELISNGSYDSYQWLDCANNYAILPGANDTVYTPTQNGNYALTVSENGCIDTSNCYVFTSTSLDDLSNRLVKLFPNPNNGSFKIDCSFCNSSTQINIYSVSGKLIFKSVYGTSSIELNQMNIVPGLYLVRLLDSNKSYLVKLIIE